MKKLRVDLSDLELAFESSSPVNIFYLNTDTGKIIPISEDAQFLYQQMNDRYYRSEIEGIDWEEAFASGRVQDWERELLLEIDQVETDVEGRYERVPIETSNGAYADMQTFIDTITDPSLQSQLKDATSGRGAFRAFKNILLDQPEERDRWFQYKHDLLVERMRNWLESIGIGVEE